ncbi:MAG TPA: hypothetical protein VL147_11985 [Devosia sp.]|nr:hypothetical protein [Devosia sp.]
MPDVTHPANAAHEQRDVDRRGLFILSVLFAAGLVLALGGLFLIFGPRSGGFAAAQTDLSAVSERDQLITYRHRQEQALNAAGWTDSAHRYAKLPIGDAMRLLASQQRPLDAAAQSDCPVVARASPRAAAHLDCEETP